MSNGLWFGSACIFAAACLGALWHGTAQAAAPPGGFPIEQVGVFTHRTVYRFRDGPRVCYMAGNFNGGELAISCVVSP